MKPSSIAPAHGSVRRWHQRAPSLTAAYVGLGMGARRADVALEQADVVLRDGEEQNIALDEVVAGNVAVLNAGDVILGNCFLLQSGDHFVDKVALTGETYPVEKIPAFSAAYVPLAQRRNELFMTRTLSVAALALARKPGSAKSPSG